MTSVSKIKLAMLSLIVGVCSIQTACTDREVASGVAGAFLGAIVVDAANNSQSAPPPRPRYRRERRSYEQCHVQTQQYCDAWGRCSQPVVTQQECYRNMSLNAETGKNSSQILIDNEAVAKRYQLSSGSAAKLVAALIMAQAAPDDSSATAAFAEIGVDLAALRAMGAKAEISQEMVNSMAKALDQEPQRTAEMLHSVVETVRAQEAAKNEAQSI